MRTIKVSEKKWNEVAENLAEWRKNRTSKPNLDLYRKIVSIVHVGEMVLDVGCGQMHLKSCLPLSSKYFGCDPFPLNDETINASAESLICQDECEFDTVFCLASLDNVQDIKASLHGINYVANQNIVILTGINIEPDKYHTHKITREILFSVLGEPKQEIEMLPNVFLFEWEM
jgi:ubiquinone/menaquinone biosynthesis C-methylase UbiE